MLWTAVFDRIEPVDATSVVYDQAYCLSHTPSVMVTRIDQITSSKGVKALNGITVRYLSYKTEVKDHLYFNLVNALISGKEPNGKTWVSPMKLYEQTLDDTALTYTVWSTPHCKGTFLGTPTVIHGSRAIDSA